MMRARSHRVAAPLLAGSLSMVFPWSATPSSSEALGAAIVACLSLTKSLAFTGSPSMTLLKGEASWIFSRTSSAVHTCRCRKLEVHTSVSVQHVTPELVLTCCAGAVQVSMGQSIQGPCKRKAGLRGAETREERSERAHGWRVGRAGVVGGVY